MTDASIHCTVCRRSGARHVMRVGHERFMVHKPCGARTREQAPEGVTVKVYPSEELKREWDAQAFWKDKFQKATETKTTPADP